MTADPVSACLIERWSAHSEPIGGEAHEPIASDALLAAIESLRDLAGVDLVRCRGLCDAAVRLADMQGDPACRARARTVLAHALNYANEFEQASAMLEAAETIAAHAQADYERARVLLVRVHTLARLGRLHDARSCGLESEALFGSLGELAWQSRALTNTAIVVRMLGEPDAAAGMLERALAVPGNDPATMAQIRNCLAEALLDSGEFVRAEQEFLTAAETLDREGSRRTAALIRGNLADLYGRQGRLALALSQFEQARQHFEVDHAPGDLGRILCEQAEVLAAIGESAIAIQLGERAAAVLEAAGMISEHTRSLRILGSLLGQSEPQRARATLLRAASLSEIAGQPHDRGRALLCLSRVELKQGHPEQALELLARARLDLDSHAADALDASLAQSELLLLVGDVDIALKHSTQAVEKAGILGVPTLLAAALDLRARCLDALGLSEQAHLEHLQAVSTIEQVRGTLGAGMLRSAWQGRCTAVYEGAVLSCIRAGHTQEAFDVLEHRWGRGILDRLSQVALATAEPASAAHTGKADKLAIAHHAVHAAYSAFDGSATGAQRAEWLQRVRTAEEHAREARLCVNAGQELGPELGHPASVDRIQRAVGHAGAVVSFLFTDTHSTAFVLTQSELRVVEIGIAADDANAIAEAVSFQMRRALARGPTAAGATRLVAAIGALGRAYDAVWRPLEDCLTGLKTVWVVAPGEFEAFPFAAMHDGASFLCERAVMHRVPQASLIPLLRQRRDTSMEPKPVGVIGCSDGIAGEMIREAEAIANCLPEARVALGDDATAEAFKQCAHECGLVHVACHGAFPRENPLAAAVKLADRWVTVREMMEWSLPGNTLVLSGCDTGRSDSRHGADPLGLLTGVLGAGGAGLLSSLWPAHDELARSLMEKLYEDIGSRPLQEQLAARLATSQQSMIRTGTHPAFWAQWVHIGV